MPFFAAMNGSDRCQSQSHSQRCRLPGLIAALLLSAGQPLLVTATVESGMVLVATSPASAQSAGTDVAKVAQAITVRIEGATPGSGVLVRRDGSRYMVLTAWHVISGQRAGEELTITTADGKEHQIDERTIQRIPDVDLALVSFVAESSYSVAVIADPERVERGQEVLVSGFPYHRQQSLFASRGTLVARAKTSIDQGYQLLYTNNTDAGMSGGAIVNQKGELVGIHGRGEIDVSASATGRIVKTGVNQGVPTGFYLAFISGRVVQGANQGSETIDDYLAQIRSLINRPGQEEAVVALANRALKLGPNPDIYFYRAIGRWLHLEACTNSHYVSVPGIASGADNKEFRGLAAALNCTTRRGRRLHRVDAAAQALSRESALDLAQAIRIRPDYAEAFNALGVILEDQGFMVSRSDDRIAFRRVYRSLGFDNHEDEVVKLYDRAIKLKPSLDIVYYNRALLTSRRSTREQVEDLRKAIALNPSNWKAHLVLAYLLRHGTCRANSGICGVTLWSKDYRLEDGTCESNLKKSIDIVKVPELLFRATDLQVSGEVSDLLSPEKFCRNHVGRDFLPSL